MFGNSRIVKAWASTSHGPDTYWQRRHPSCDQRLLLSGNSRHPVSARRVLIPSRDFSGDTINLGLVPTFLSCFDKCQRIANASRSMLQLTKLPVGSCQIGISCDMVHAANSSSNVFAPSNRAFEVREAQQTPHRRTTRMPKPFAPVSSRRYRLSSHLASLLALWQGLDPVVVDGRWNGPDRRIDRARRKAARSKDP